MIGELQYNCPGVVPFAGGGPSLVLHSDLVTNAKGWEEFGVFLLFLWLTMCRFLKASSLAKSGSLHV